MRSCVMASGLRPRCRPWLRRLACSVALSLAALLLALTAPRPTGADSPAAGARDEPALSPFWEPAIQRRATTIAALSAAYGFHPDFIAAVIANESRERRAIGRLGAVGLMNVLSDVSEWQPSSEAMLWPSSNLLWGMAVLSYVVQQAGGDLHTALAAYHGGWQHANGRMPREYAARVLDSYARALLVGAGLSPESAARWTVAVDIRAGNVPDETLLVMGQMPPVAVPVAPRRAAFADRASFAPPVAYARHTIYAFADESGHAYYVRGAVVPVGLAELVATESGSDNPDELEAPLRARLGEKSAGSAAGNPRVLLACLAGLTRLRGQVTTRWYGPSGCPATGR